VKKQDWSFSRPADFFIAVKNEPTRSNEILQQCGGWHQFYHGELSAKYFR